MSEYIQIYVQSASPHPIVVRRARLRWFGHLERMVGEEWVSACRNVKVEGKVCRGVGNAEM